MDVKLRPLLHKHVFPFFLNPMGREQKYAFKTPNSPLFLSALLGSGNLIFLRFYRAGKRDYELLRAKRSIQVSGNPSLGPETLQTVPFALPSALFRESQNKRSCGWLQCAWRASETSSSRLSVVITWFMQRPSSPCSVTFF